MNTIMPKACCQRYTKKPASGFTLVELLVSIFIGLILLAVMSLAFLSNKQSYRVQDSSAQMQENGRYAIEVLTRDIRLAGYWGGFEYSVRSSPPSLVKAISPTTCSPANWAWMAAQRVYGLNGIITGDGTAAGDFAACIPARTAGDAVVVRHASPNTLTTAELKTDGLYLISDIDRAELFTGSTPPTPPAIKQPNAMHQMTANAYYLGNSLVVCSDGGPTLGGPLKGLQRLFSTSEREVKTDEIIGGVDDFQVMYGVDNVNAASSLVYNAGTLDKDKDHTVDFYTDAAPAADWPNVISVRIWLLLRAACGESGYENTSTYTNPAGAVTPAAKDSIRRQVFTTTINLRNPRYP